MSWLSDISETRQVWAAGEVYLLFILILIVKISHLIIKSYLELNEGSYIPKHASNNGCVRKRDGGRMAVLQRVSNNFPNFIDITN